MFRETIPGDKMTLFRLETTLESKITEYIIATLLNITADYSFASDIVKTIASVQGIDTESPIFSRDAFLVVSMDLGKQIRGMTGEILLDIVAQIKNNRSKIDITTEKIRAFMDKYKTWDISFPISAGMITSIEGEHKGIRVVDHSSIFKLSLDPMLYSSEFRLNTETLVYLKNEYFININQDTIILSGFGYDKSMEDFLIEIYILGKWSPDRYEENLREKKELCLKKELTDGILGVLSKEEGKQLKTLENTPKDVLLDFILSALLKRTAHRTFLQEVVNKIVQGRDIQERSPITKTFEFTTAKMYLGKRVKRLIAGILCGIVE